MGITNIKKTILYTVFASTFMLIPGPSSAEVMDRIVAVVNDGIITLSELNAATAVDKQEQMLKGGNEDFDAIEMKSRILDKLIERKLVTQAADRTGIEVSEKEIDNAVNDVKNQNKLSQEALLVALARSGLTIKEYRDQLKEQIREVKFTTKRFRSGIVIEPQDVEEYYRQHAEDFFTPPTYRIRLITLIGEAGPGRDERLKVVMDELSSGTPFANVASTYSDGAAASDGGNLGHVTKGSLDSSVEDVALRLKPGETSEPIHSNTAVNIIQLVERKQSEAKPFEEIKGEIRQKIYDIMLEERYNTWLEQMKNLAHIEVRL